MKVFLATIGIYLVVGAIMGTVTALLVPGIDWWRLSVVIGGTVILTTNAHGICQKIEKKLAAKK